MAWSAEDPQKPERGRFLRESWARNLLVARRAKAGSRDREKFSVKLMSCRAEADGTLDGGEAEEDNEEKRVCRVALLVTHAKAC